MQIADIRFDGLHVVVRRDPNGRIAVSGIYTDTQVGTIAQTPTQDDGLADVLSALLLLGRIDFTNGSIVFNDAVRGIDYAFPKTNIHLQNTGDQHQVYAHIALPPRWANNWIFTWIWSVVAPISTVGTVLRISLGAGCN